LLDTQNNFFQNGDWNLGDRFYPFRFGEFVRGETLDNIQNESIQQRRELLTSAGDSFKQQAMKSRMSLDPSLSVSLGGLIRGMSSITWN
jgi:hypothetical protein